MSLIEESRAVAEKLNRQRSWARFMTERVRPVKDNSKHDETKLIVIEKYEYRRAQWFKVTKKIKARQKGRQIDRKAPAYQLQLCPKPIQVPLKNASEAWAELENQLILDKIKQSNKEFMENLPEETFPTFTWIRNPITRTFTHALNSDLEIVKVENVEHLPKVMPDSSWNTICKDGKIIINPEPDNEPIPIIVNRKAPVDIIDIDDTKQLNSDVPLNISFGEMGINERVEEPNVKMDDRHFREMCVTGHSGLLRLYQKTKADFAPPYWKQEEWYMEHLDGCTYKEANRFIVTIEKLKLRKEDILKLIHGYYNIKTNRYRKGLKERSGWRKVIGRFNNMARKLQELKKNPVHSGETNAEKENEQKLALAREFVTGVSEYSLANALADKDMQTMISLLQVRVMEDEKADQAPDERVYEDRFNEPGDSAFGAARLYYGAESVSHALLTFINKAMRWELHEVRKGMFPQEDKWGNKRRAKYYYLTPMQKSQVWRYIKDRKKKLDNGQAFLDSKCNEDLEILF